ncbi:MAG: hypothetical protein DSZ00_01975 [Gammaproteobacteria bacterium]|nr:MAG: hypothetical protein DSZ02_04960 [Gammaproteobacteria bacterium]RTZ75408.1 MAG: hypothetical protein DSZ00_01975 [Gammaproteobacteria bacterium]
MSTFVLDEVLMKIEQAPHSAAALVLYALVNTLEYERAGCLFKLTKLRDLEAEERQIAYRLMELMAEGGNRGARWDEVKQRMDELVRSG